LILSDILSAKVSIIDETDIVDQNIKDDLNDAENDIKSDISSAVTTIDG